MFGRISTATTESPRDFVSNISDTIIWDPVREENESLASTYRPVVGIIPLLTESTE
jgi:hypothetical protein